MDCSNFSSSSIRDSGRAVGALARDMMSFSLVVETVIEMFSWCFWAANASRCSANVFRFSATPLQIFWSYRKEEHLCLQCNLTKQKGTIKSRDQLFSYTPICPLGRLILPTHLLRGIIFVVKFIITVVSYRPLYPSISVKIFRTRITKLSIFLVASLNISLSPLGTFVYQ